MKSKRNFLIGFLLVVLLLCYTVGCSSPAAEPGNGGNDNGQAAGEQKPIELKMADFFPANHVAVTVNVQSWIDAVEEATEGKVKIIHYPGETLLKADDILGGVISGVADIGHTCVTYDVGRLPLMQVVGLPGVEVLSSKASSYTAWDMMVKEGGEKYKELQDVKVPFVYGITSAAFHTQRPINTLEDLKGMQIRVTAPAVEPMEALGAVPIAMPMSEAYEALSKGVVEGALVASEVLEGWNIADVTKYTTIVPIFFTDFHYFPMNLDVWNSLTPEIQQAIESASQRVHEEISCKLWDEVDESSLKYAIEETGQIVTTLSESEKQKMVEILEPLQEKWIEEMESKGLPGREVAEEFKSRIAKYGEMFN